MKFDGINWRRTRTVLPLPYDSKIENSNYVRFGKIVDIGTKGAIQSAYITDESQPIFVKPIPCNGHSLTNMMYGNYEVHYGEVFARAYLQWKGLTYTARWYHTKKTQEYKQTGKVTQ